jgi:hypothetical protein
MTTPTPTPEAVEAAMRSAKSESYANDDWNLIGEFYDRYAEIRAHGVSRILAAEVERLRGELDRAEQKIEADRIARDHIIAKGVALEKELERRHAEYAKALNKRVDVESQLIDIGAGKRDLPTREECMAWALKLGNS